MGISILLSYLVAIATGYLLGSLNGAQLLHHALRRYFPLHITRIGTKNAGLTNFWLSIAKFPAIFVFFIDIGKGYAAIFFARMLGIDDPLSLLAGIAAIAGHNWPLYFHFRGGRGVATLVGTALAYDAQTTLFLLLALFLPLSLIRWSGLAPFALIAGIAIIQYPMHSYSIVVVGILAAIVLFVRRVHAEWDTLSASDRKFWILKNILWYDRSSANPPPLRDILNFRQMKT